MFREEKSKLILTRAIAGCNFNGISRPGLKWYVKILPGFHSRKDHAKRLIPGLEIAEHSWYSYIWLGRGGDLAHET
jgi:hypothetical protein